MSFMNDVLALSHVPRWAVVRHYRPQTVSDHTFRVLVILWELMRRMPHLGGRQSSMLLYALFHDADESVTGDIPSHVKDHKTFPPVLNAPTVPITLAEIKLVKLADLIESYTWICMNGVGPHASEVNAYLFSKIRDHMTDMRFVTEKDPIVGSSEEYRTIMKIIHEILDEAGRLHVVEEHGRVR